MEIRTQEYNGYTLSNDPQKLQPQAVHHYLSTDSYWAKGISLALVQKAMDNSECFGIYQEEAQVGFARWITDHATFAYLADVYVLPEHRGKGLSKALMEFMMAEPEIHSCRHLLLATLDAHGLYAKSGFGQLTEPQRYMNIIKLNAYL